MKITKRITEKEIDLATNPKNPNMYAILRGILKNFSWRIDQLEEE